MCAGVQPHRVRFGVRSRGEAEVQALSANCLTPDCQAPITEYSL